ncbi:MAG TPA: peptidylprolyl isomerase [Bacteroidales bacterium]|nr:peptidylprolyl isomerase [Bacteroidales bacterium]HPJ59482.1 peptidylprolyl isomerase [Bacteroidales bacterium]HPR12865.1 peptidylprolyl isomerase [Bacteroidales bacterium]HRW85108.1 peptidylprolyl isomerase [Bacteroidales bacterium]
MKPLILLLLIFLAYPWYAGCQTPDEKVLMTIAGREVTAGEFLRMYRKSLEPGQTGSPEEYLSLYVNFKLKVADAINEGIDTTAAFRNELNGYRNQLAQNYLTDNEIREELLRKTYQRYQTEINAWHVLVSCPENASPEDTLAAWKKAEALRQRIVSGEPFEQVARGASDDPSVKNNGGNLGYFTVFQMITPFEEAAYNLRQGAVSHPVRTPYGYHIIKVTDKRASRGKILAAHIMKVSPPGTGEKEAKAAEDAINNIYSQLQEGASFSELARLHSDHRESAANGGRLNWFGTGELISELSEAAFAITDTGKYSRPVRTVFAWHIIKLLDRQAPGTFEETRSFLESKLNQTYLNSLSRKSFVEKLKKEYNFNVNEAAMNWFIVNTDTSKIRGLEKYNRAKMPAGNIYSFADLHFTNRDFAAYLEKRASRLATTDPGYFIKQSIETSISDQIIKYEDALLEEKYPDFRYLMTEFHDGILLFEISGRKIWNRVQEDSAGLHDYYESHKKEFFAPESVTAKIYTLRNSTGEKKFIRNYRKFSRKPETDSLMIGFYNRGNDSLLIIREGTFIRGDETVIDMVRWSEGSHITRSGGFPSVVVISEVRQPQPMAFDEVQGEMINGYQGLLENRWIEQLKQRYAVTINDQVLDEIRKRIADE